jgi:DNA-binding CsgD family transcriptional regulator/tetratricopeptide (TPR) repeat protein
MPRPAEPSQNVLIAPVPSWLAGRERAWRQLTGCLAAAAQGAGSVAAVSGEAGVGKTALVEALLDAARQCGALVLTGGCYDLTITPPYGPWSEALAGYRAGGELPELPAALREPTSAAIASSQALHEQTRAFLADVAARQPVVLLLEDLHWADAASLELLRAVGRRLDGLALLLVVTWRDDEAAHAQPLYRLLPALVRETQPTRIELHRLQPADMCELVARRYALPLADRDALAEWVQRHAEGNPFFAGEVLLALERGGALREAGDTWRFTPPGAFSVPPLARQVIEERLSRLSASAQRLLEYAAILGPEASLALIQAATDATDDELAATLEEVVAARLIVAPLTDTLALRVRFQHALVRETLYERQALFRRRARHRRIAELLLTVPEPSAVALGYHFQAARDPRAVTWLTRAGELSLALYAPDDAIAHVTRADELARGFGMPLPPAALCARAHAWEMTGDYARAREDFEAALRGAREAGDRRAEWQILLDLGALWAERDYDRAGDAVRAALDLARAELDEAAVAHSLNALGNWLTNREALPAALRSHEDALTIFTRLADQTGIAATLDLLGVAHYVAGDMQRAAQRYARAVRLLEDLDDRQRLSSALATWATASGNWETHAAVVTEEGFEPWRHVIARARSLAIEIGWLAGQAYAEIQAGAIIGLRGDAGQALALADAGMALAERIGHRQWTVSGHVTLGHIHADLFDMGPARRHLESALAQAHAINSPYWVRTSAAGLGSLLVEAGDLDAAAFVLESAIDATRVADSLSQRHCQLAWSQLQNARGAPDRALRVIEQLFASTPNVAGPRSLPSLAFVRGDALAALGRVEEAEADYGAALLGARGLEYRQLEWRVEAALARLLRHTGRAPEARAAEERALTLVDAIAATLSSEALRATFRRGARDNLPTVRAGTPTAPFTGGLSPRELDVLRLVAQGCADAEVGEQLFISHRTVGRHLQSIYNKLGVNSRTAAVAYAFEHGLVVRSVSN